MTQAPRDSDPIDDLLRRAMQPLRKAPDDLLGRVRRQVCAKRAAGRRQRAWVRTALATLAIAASIAVVTTLTNSGPGRDQVADSTPDSKLRPSETAASTPDSEPLPPESATPDSDSEPLPPESATPASDSVPLPPESATPDSEADSSSDAGLSSEPVVPQGPRTGPSAGEPFRVALVTEKPRLQVRLGGGSKWRAPRPGESFAAGVSLRARGIVDLSLEGGGLLRFDGEIALAGTAKAPKVDLGRKSIYVDTGSAPLTVRSKHAEVAVRSGEALLSASGAALVVASLRGDVVCLGAAVAAGLQVRVDRRGRGRAKRFKGHSLLRRLPDRLVLRESFDAQPPGEGGLYRGELRDGSAWNRGSDRGVAFRYALGVRVERGMRLRLRLKTHGVKTLELEMRGAGIRGGFLLRRASQGEGGWRVIDLRLSEVPRREDPSRAVEVGDVLTDLRLDMEGLGSCELELDWVEIVRERGFID